MERAKIFVGTLLAGLCVFMVFLHLAREAVRPTANDSVLSDTIRVVVYDTIKVIKPVPRDSIVVRFDTERLPIEQEAAPDRNVVTSPDSADVIIPITTKQYHGEGYDAWVSGYRATLDSLFLNQQYQTIRIREPPKRWHVGPSVGVSVTPHGIEPFAGVSLTFSILSF